MGSKSAIGIGNGICFKQVRDKGGGSYIDPLVRDSIVGLWKSDQNTNESPTRNIIKNTIKDKGGDLELLNFAYKANSGYNGYLEDFTSWGSDGVVKEKSSYTFLGKSPVGYDLLVVYMADSSAVESFKVEAKISGRLLYRYYVNDGDSISVAYYELKEGINTLPYSVDSTLIGGKTGFVAKDFASFEIAQLPLYKGALVTDGKDDMIVSQKTVQEMLGGSNEITVVSMMLNLENEKITYTNQIRPFQNEYIRNNVISNTEGKCGIYGYEITDISDIFKNRISINDILGDKKDYSMDTGDTARIDGKFSVEGYCFNDGTIGEVSQVAWYWTFISNKALTTDQINQVISHFNLDKHVKPDIIYDTIRQGITNENHASFNDELVDFSGNGNNMKIYNSAWNKESGINDEGAWQTDGVSDYGKVTGMPIYKDYTVVADRTAIGTLEQLDGGVSAKCAKYLNGSFVMDYKDSAFSFGGQRYLVPTLSRIISYQSKYISNGKEIVAGNSSDVSDLYIGKLGIADRYAAIALYSYLLFPYSLSEFLLERQLKRYKLGTLYPGMIEWRPKVNINVPVVTPPTFSMNNGSDIITNGQYIPEGTEITIRIFTTTDSSVEGLNEATAKINGVDIELSPSGNKTYYEGKFIVSSKQKIDITIDEYIRYEDIVQPYPAIINLK